MSFFDEIQKLEDVAVHELVKAKARVAKALETATPVVLHGEAVLQPLLGVPGTPGKVALVTSEGLKAVEFLIDEVKHLLSKIPDPVPAAPEVPVPDAAAGV